MHQVIELLIAAILAAATATPLPSPPPSHYEGSLSRYDAGVFTAVLEWRHENGIPNGFDPFQPEYDGFIAVVDCRNVGRVGWLIATVDGVGQERRRVYVGDCASPGTAAARWMEENRIAAEVDYEAWQAWGIVDGRGAWVTIELE